MKILSHTNFNKNEVQNAVLQNLASAPSSPIAGQVYFDTTLGKQGTYNGSSWDYAGSGTGDVTQATNSGATGRVKVSAGANKQIQDYSGSAGLLKTTDANGTLATATAGTDYVTAASTNTFTNKTFDANGTGNTLSNVETADFAAGVIQTSISAGSTNSQIPTALSVYNAIQAGFGSNDAMLFKGGIDASTNPNYPAADAGHAYKITVAGKIGGASGIDVQIGDTIYCTVDATSAGTQAAVGANWVIVQANVDRATTTTLGLAEHATQAETEAKSSSTVVVTPDTLVNFPIKKLFTIGDGTSTSIACTHSLGTKDVMTQVRDASTDAVVECDITNTSTSVTTLTFTTAPTTNSLKVVIIG